MSCLFRKNDRAKVIFLPHHNVLFEVDGNHGKLKLPVHVFETVYCVYKDSIIAEIAEEDMNLFRDLVHSKILMESDNTFSEYAGTMFDKTNYLFNSLVGKNNIIVTLQTKKVMMIGLGGIGTEVINHLLAVGIRQFVLVEFDIVSESNFNRQYIYKKADVGKSKTEVVSTYIYDKNPDAIISKYEERIEDCARLQAILGQEATCDIMICAADTPPCYLQRMVTDASIAADVPCIFCGVGIEGGTIGPLLVDSSSKELFRNSYNAFIEANAQIFPSSASIGVTNSIIGAYLASDVIFFLAGRHEFVKSLDKPFDITVLDADYGHK